MTDRRHVSECPEGRLDLADFVGESMLLIGAGATVLLQLAVPGVGRGVAEHSTTLERPLDRLRTTMTFVYAVTLGSAEEKQTVVRLVNRAHVPVRSKRYNAFDPELQLWVAATLYRNGFDMYERFFGRLSDHDGVAGRLPPPPASAAPDHGHLLPAGHAPAPGGGEPPDLTTPGGQSATSRSRPNQKCSPPSNTSVPLPFMTPMTVSSSTFLKWSSTGMPS